VFVFGQLLSILIDILTNQKKLKKSEKGRSIFVSKMAQTYDRMQLNSNNINSSCSSHLNDSLGSAAGNTNSKGHAKIVIS